MPLMYYCEIVIAVLFDPWRCACSSWPSIVNLWYDASCCCTVLEKAPTILVASHTSYPRNVVMFSLI